MNWHVFFLALAFPAGFATFGCFMRAATYYIEDEEAKARKVMPWLISLAVVTALLAGAAA